MATYDPKRKIALLDPLSFSELKWIFIFQEKRAVTSVIFPDTVNTTFCIVYNNLRMIGCSRSESVLQTQLFMRLKYRSISYTRAIDKITLEKKL